jgi:hypothetical protein
MDTGSAWNGWRSGRTGHSRPSRQGNTGRDWPAVGSNRILSDRDSPRAVHELPKVEVTLSGFGVSDKTVEKWCIFKEKRPAFSRRKGHEQREPTND